MAQIDGPYLNFAVICEKVLHEADGVLSFIRLVDHLTVTMTIPAGADVPQEAVPPEPPVVVTFALGLKSPSDIGPVPVKVRIETPSGLTLPEFETSQPVGAEDRAPQARRVHRGAGGTRHRSHDNQGRPCRPDRDNA